jgi:hypothetical protein
MSSNATTARSVWTPVFCDFCGEPISSEDGVVYVNLISFQYRTDGCNTSVGMEAGV